MRLDELTNQLERIRRDIARTNRRTGDGHTHTVEDDGRVVRYTINGVPQMQELEDAVDHALIDLWSLRDYLVGALCQQGTLRPEARKVVNDYVREHPSLRLTADLANTIKHGQLRDEGWTKRRPRLGRGIYTLNNRRARDGTLQVAAIRQLTYRANEIVIDVQNQDDARAIDFRRPILDPGGQEIGDACTVIAQAHRAWLEFLETHDLRWPRRTGGKQQETGGA